MVFVFRKSLLLFFMLWGLVLLHLSCGQKDPPLMVAREGSLAVLSDPAGASILLDGTETGRVTPDTLTNIAVGSYAISVMHQGYTSCTESLEVNVVEDQTVQVEFVLVNIQRVVLGEDFTSTTCTPCNRSSLALDSLAEKYRERFAVIRYHVWWPPPGNDPYYLANTEENVARNNYYDNMDAPHLYLDGEVDAGGDHAQWESLLLERMGQQGLIDLTVSAALNGMYGSATASLISCSDLSARDLVIQFALTESDIQFDAPNGQDVFHQVLRDMLPDAGGEAIDLFTHVTKQVHREFHIESGWNADNMSLIVFVQDHDTREVLQATSVHL